MKPTGDTAPLDGPVPVLWVGDRRFALKQGVNRVGRDPASEVRIADASVSRAHARIDVHLIEATIDDLGSTNGTWVGGVPIHGPTSVKAGDVLMFGAVAARFAVESPDLPTTLD